MSDNISVRESSDQSALPVATSELAGVHYPQYMMVDSTGAVVAYVDSFSGAVGSIDQEHLQIHRGVTYTISRQVTIDDSGGATPTYEFLASVPASTYPHFRHIIVQSDGGPFVVELYEGTTTSADGTSITPYNNNRNSSNTSSTACYYGPTITDDGTLIEAFLAPSTKGSFGSDGANEWILKPSTKYMVRITNNTAGAGTSEFVVNINWYEG